MADTVLRLGVAARTRGAAAHECHSLHFCDNEQVQAYRGQVGSLQDKLHAAVDEREELRAELAAAKRQIEVQQSYGALLTNIGQTLRPTGSPRVVAAELGLAATP